MPTINLRKYYRWYRHDEFVEVSKEVLAELESGRCYDDSHRRRMNRNKSQYSLDYGNGIEKYALYPVSLPHQVFEFEDALASLPLTQRRRIEAYYLHGISQREIARQENAKFQNINSSIKRGLKNLKKYLQSRD